jgi:hypothetical protein
MVKKSTKNFRFDDRGLAMLAALEENGIGENNTDRVMMGLERLVKAHRIAVPA